MNDVENKIIEQLAITTLPPRSIKLPIWNSWYRNLVPGFHEYKYIHNNRNLDMHRKSLGMAKAVCETWARVLLNEKCDIVIPDNDKDNLTKLLKDLKFWSVANKGIEKSFALGLGALVIGVNGLTIGDKGSLVTSGAKMTLEFVNHFKIYPIKIEHNQVVECAFATVQDKFTTIVIHQRDENGLYIIKTLNYENNVLQGEITEFKTLSNIAWFFLMKPSLESNFVDESGNEIERSISIYANAIDIMSSIDSKYDDIDWEFKANKAKVYVSAEAIEDNARENPGDSGFNADNVIFTPLPGGTTLEDGKPYIETVGNPIRVQQYIDGLNEDLSLLTYKCGLGENYFNFNGVALMTATQVISEKSTMYGNVKKHEASLESMLVDFTLALTRASTQFTDIKFSDIKDTDVAIQFDDSIFEDSNTEMERDRADVTAGILSPIEYRMRWLGEDEDSANENYSKYFTNILLEKYTPYYTQGLMTATDFVEKVYPFALNKEEIIKYIEEQKETSNEYNMNEMYIDNKDGEDTETDNEETESVEKEDDEDDTKNN